MNAQNVLNTFSELTAITNEYIKTKCDDDKNLYNKACNVIANDLQNKSTTDIAQTMLSNIDIVFKDYNIGKLFYEKNNMPLPPFEEIVGQGRALRIYDEFIEEENKQKN